MAIKIINPIINHVEGGGASFNIHYGLNPPDDTSMLWVETESEPSKVEVNVIGNANLVQNLPVALYSASCASVGTKIYIFGGYTGSIVNTIYEYDTEASVLTTLSATLPKASRFHSIAVIGTNIYLFYGVGATTAIYRFDSVEKTIETLSVSPSTGYQYVACAVVDNLVYFFGGQTTSYSISAIQSFDPETNTFATKSASLPNGVNSYLSAVAVDEKVYLFGGHVQSSSASRDDIFVYDVANDTCKVMNTLLPETLKWGSGCGCAVGTNIYLFGGNHRVGSVNEYRDAIYIYDTIADTIRELPSKLPFGMEASICKVDNNAYLIGGSSGGGRMNTIYAYDLSKEIVVGQNDIFLATSLTKNIFNLIEGDNLVRIGVDKVYTGNENSVPVVIKAYLYNSTEWEEI